MTSERGDIYIGLRSLYLEPDWLKNGRRPSSEFANVWAAFLEETTDSGSGYTLVAVADGTTSLYISNGGGRIGAGGWPETAEASRRFLLASDSAAAQLTAQESVPLPRKHEIGLVAITFAGPRATLMSIDALMAADPNLVAMYRAGQDVITTIRLRETATRP